MESRGSVPSGRQLGEVRGAAPLMPPFVSTRQFMSLTNITKSQRTNMQKVGVCEPAKVIQGGKHYYYMLDQLQEADLASVMLASGMSYDELGGAFGEAPDTVDEIAYRCAEENQRASRRAVKRMAFLRKRVKSTRDVIGVEGWYLRYLPNRWFALIPSSSQDVLFETPDKLACNYCELLGVADVVGWARTTLLGALDSFSADGGNRGSWQFVELSSPPTPIVTGSLVVDGGCYRTVHSDGGSSECDAMRCFECSRYGREPTDDERLRWREAGSRRPHLWDGCLMAQDMEEPYKFGMWADFTAAYLTEKSSRSDGEKRQKSCPTLRPRLMPLVFRLPMGVTACAFPAGVYLCRQEAYEERGWGSFHLVDTLRGLESFAFTESMEEDAIRCFRANCPDEHSRSLMSPVGHGGPYLEPFAMPRGGGDPRYLSWHRRLQDGELSKLRVPYNMALWPQDGFAVIAESLPDAYATGKALKEYQVYVDPGSLGPDGYRVFGGDAGFTRS